MVPADDAFVEHLHVAVAAFVEYAIGQTGQVMGAGSIKHEKPVPWQTLHIIFELNQRRGYRAQNMRFAVLFRRAYVDDHRFGAGF